ncbi:winged helix-turn-helix transcriptional regulator [Atopomonas sediminilitoris]|uniref:winged helix-turn-helix transcriptional regulator n=1 Tax=Atopomonas sediminilitoris TaxID=2919919 RepID=UPI001F4D8509|nr:helix-turn-helix domain-containing protein [Atopomonas sediminilitoris]MCJ8169342.1 helix-turn-helix transcriptional regulator [Atopomonas sediminilitoris]
MDTEPSVFSGCPVEVSLDVIGGKWKGVIVYHLLAGTQRFGQLQRLLPGISQRVLTKQLREMEAHGLIERTVHPVVPPHVDYALSPLGHELAPVIAALKHWGQTFLAQGGEPQRCDQAQWQTPN